MGYSTLMTAMIIDIEGGGIFKFQLIPNTITDSKSASYTPYNILGRSSPLQGYQMSQPRKIDFQGVKLFASPTANGPPMPPPLIKQQVDFVLSLPYPDYAGGIKPPHKCLLIFGGNVQMIGVCESASASYEAGTPWDLGPGLTHGVTLSMSFMEVKDVPIDTWTRRAGGF